MNDKDRTSFCGLWCGDCIPANEKIYELTSELNQLLAEIGFKNYSDFKSKKVSEFNDYDIFIRVLNAFEKLHCYNYCRKGPRSEAGCNTACKIRVCVIEKNIEGCWECDIYTSCERITRMESFHPDIKHNLTMIKEHGIEGWKEHRGRHYQWNKQHTE